MAIRPIELADGIQLGGKQPVLFCGPCLIESRDMALRIAETARELAEKHGFQFVFKGSFDKANRTSLHSPRTIGHEKALAILAEIRESLGIPTLTDVHDVAQVERVAQAVDVIQIPAFLCRQTDLLVAAGRSGRAVNVKRGQFLPAEDMEYALEKVRSGGTQRVYSTERGTTFGTRDLVVDFRSLIQLRQTAPVVYDVTHSVQRLGARGGSTGGSRQYAAALGRAAGAVGVDGFYIESHPSPEMALSDAAVMIPLTDLDAVLAGLVASWEVGIFHLAS